MQARYASLLLATAIIAAAGVAGAQTAPAGQDVQSQNGAPQAGLLLPAIQKARDASPRGPRPQNGATATQNAELTPGSSPQHAPSSPPPPPPPPPPRPPSGGGSLPGETLSLNFEEIKVTGESAGADDVQQPPSEASHDYFLRLPGVEGESDPPPPPPPPPPPAPMHSEQGVSAGASEPQAALIVPAVQRVREAAASEQPVDPEMPVCPHCGADVAANQQAAAPAQQPDARSERPRRNFSISIGGVTVGTNGVNVAVGDVNGDGGNARSRGRTSSSGGGSAGRGSSTASAPRR